MMLQRMWGKLWIGRLVSVAAIAMVAFGGMPLQSQIHRAPISWTTRRG
jgi:hypothetical protein